MYLCEYYWWNDQTKDVFRFQIQCDEVCDIAFRYRKTGCITSAGYCDFYYYSVIVKDDEIFKLLKIKVAEITTRFKEPVLTHPEFRPQEVEVLVEKRAEEVYWDDNNLFLSDEKEDCLYCLYSGRLIHTFPSRVEVSISTDSFGSKRFEHFTAVDGWRYKLGVVERKKEVMIDGVSRCNCSVKTSSGVVSISAHTKRALRKEARAVVVKDKRNMFLELKTSGDLPFGYSNWKKIFNGQKSLTKSRMKWSVTLKTGS